MESKWPQQLQLQDLALGLSLKDASTSSSSGIVMSVEELRLKYDNLVNEINELHSSGAFLDKDEHERRRLIWALDFWDQFGAFQPFYFCRAKLSDQTSCGCYYPSKLWHNLQKNNVYHCRLDWGLALQRINGIRELMQQSGWRKDIATWPTVGCGLKFLPWGAANVIEFEDPRTKQWVCFLATLMPEVLYTELEKYKEPFFQAVQNVNEDVLLEHIPLIYPETNPSVLGPPAGSGLSPGQRGIQAAGCSQWTNSLGTVARS